MSSTVPQEAVEAVIEPPMLPESLTSTTALVMNPEAIANMIAVADLMASAKATIPVHLRGNRGDCLAICMQAMQWGMMPFAIAQKTHLINGVLGYEAQLVNAVIISRAPIKTRLSYEWFGDWSKIVGKFVERESRSKKDDEGNPQKYRAPAWQISDEAGLGVRVWATFKGENEPRFLELLMTQARTRNSTLWADDPKQQLAYLATKRWARLYAPDVLLGVYTPDELEDVAPPAERDITPRKTDAAATGESDALRAALIATLERRAALGGDAVTAEWRAMSADQRRQIPNDVWARIKVMAADADRRRTIEPEPSETNATAGPTYAELMNRLKAATDADALQQVLSDSTHLTEQMRGEIGAAVSARAQELGQ